MYMSVYISTFKTRISVSFVHLTVLRFQVESSSNHYSNKKVEVLCHCPIRE